MNGALEEFRSAIAEAGLTPPAFISTDGKLHRFSSDGRRADRAGWYVYHNGDIPAGAFGCWRGDLSVTWRADIGRSLTPEEERAHKARMEAAQRKREEEEIKVRAQARAKAASLWQAARPAPAAHPYLDRKRIKAHGLRSHLGELVVPLRDTESELHSLQFIAADGRKQFLNMAV